MSRFEPNVEPSMEEILASIRKIIAEDTSGSRTVPPPAPSRAPQSPDRPNAGAKPIGSQQRGFMSRDAFMKSSAPADEAGEPRFFTPVTPPQDASPADQGAKPASEVRTATKAAEPLLAADARVNAKSTEVVTVAAAPGERPKPSTPSLEPVNLKSGDKSADKSVEAEVKAIVEAEQKASTPGTSETQLIDAQLVELLGEDLKALREADERQSWTNSPTLSAAAKVAPEPEVVAPKPMEPAAKVNGAASAAVTPSVAARIEAPEAAAVSDPFAFDLGPSPFLPRSLNEKGPEEKISIDPPLASGGSNAPARDDARPAPAQHAWTKVNGTPVAPDKARPAAPAPASIARPQEAQTPQAAPSAPATPRPAPFAVPSVSATLGPHRKLEPLSESFKADAPAAPRQADPPLDPFPFRALPRSFETPVDPPRPALENRLQPASSPPLSALPPLDVEADPVIGGDRTMEDAVADLLRPLLKTWLAENMPKIVERALRREMTERLLPGQKNSRD